MRGALPLPRPHIAEPSQDFVVPLGVLCVLAGTIVSLCVLVPAGSFY